MSKKHNQEVDTNIESLSKAEAFITKNNKKIIAGIVVALVLVVGFLLIRFFCDQKVAQGQEALTFTEQNAIMASDSLTNAAALADLEQYINEFGGSAVPVASFEAGIAAYEIGRASCRERV